MVTIPFKRQRVIFDSLADSNYKNYLDTDEWKEKRAKLKDKAKGECQLCNKVIGNKGVVHHTSYNDLFKETGNNEIYICRDCHLDSHNNH